MPKKKSSYYYSQKRKRNNPSTYWYKRLVIYLIAIILLLSFLWFGGIAVFSNINSFWRVINGDLFLEEAVSKDDTIPPQPPRVNNIPVATNDGKIKISGYSEAESIVTAYLNGEKAEAQEVNEEGYFDFTVNLKSGENKITLKAKDKSDNESQSTKEFFVMFDKTAPEIKITSPDNGAVVDEKTLTITGEVNKEVTVTINDYFAIVDDEGQFSFNLVLNKGKNEIQIKAIDQAENSTKSTLEVTFEPKKD